jgi:hypothetical protein
MGFRTVDEENDLVLIKNYRPAETDIEPSPPVLFEVAIIIESYIANSIPFASLTPVFLTILDYNLSRRKSLCQTRVR